MAIPVLGNIWQLARRVEDLFTDVAKLVQGLAAARDELRDLEKRVTALEGREELLVEKTRTAASMAASSAVTTHLVDMSRRIGALEAGQGSQRRIE
jgi:predicted  nucleic acid-binding Zn-ribbon protein